ncbi:MAG: heparinase II/III family protein, partial [Proteobacteria bacterium]|nr:heparinase II/III family protein [Pseudomonadota bacterium]
MSSVSIADRLKMSWRLPRRRLLHVVGRIETIRLLRLPTLPGRADRLIIAPQDLRTADPTRSSEIYAGRFAFAGKIVVCDGRSPFEMTPPSDEWAETLLGFGWLRHLRAAESTITRANARALVEEWISLHGGWNALAWRPEILSRRVISWLSQAPLILDSVEPRFYRRFMRSLVRQVRYLRRVAPSTRDGTCQMQARMALVYASLCMASQMRHLRNATRQFVAEIERQVLADGTHASRNPGALIEVLLDFLPLNHAFTARNIPPPAALQNAIDRMMPMLRFFRHGDGNFALFNGMGPTPPDLLATILAYDDAGGTPVASATHGGYQRLEAGDCVVLMDTGRPPPLALSAEAHAGCLAFELSVRHQRVVVNCGLPATSRENWRQLARATAAHSTVTFNDASSCRLGTSRVYRRLLGVPIVAGPRRVPVAREDRDGAVVVRASHDGYAERFNALHQRTLLLHAGGVRLDGE